MSYKSLFLDSDVILDWLLNREPFAFYSKVLLATSRNNNVKVFTSALVIANIQFIISKQMNSVVAKRHVKTLVSILSILPFEADAIDFALNSAFTDFEDAIQYAIATKNNCDAIITRNIKDYKNTTIPVLTAEQFLNTL